MCVIVCVWVCLCVHVTVLNVCLCAACNTVQRQDVWHGYSLQSLPQESNQISPWESSSKGQQSYATRTKSAPFSDLKRTAPFPLQHWQWEGLGACCCRHQMLQELCHTLPPLCIPTTGKVERKKQIICGFVWLMHNSFMSGEGQSSMKGKHHLTNSLQISSRHTFCRTQLIGV